MNLNRLQFIKTTIAVAVAAIFGTKKAKSALTPPMPKWVAQFKELQKTRVIQWVITDYHCSKSIWQTDHETIRMSNGREITLQRSSEVHRRFDPFNYWLTTLTFVSGEKELFICQGLKVHRATPGRTRIMPLVISADITFEELETLYDYGAFDPCDGRVHTRSIYFCDSPARGARFDVTFGRKARYIS